MNVLGKITVAALLSASAFAANADADADRAAFCARIGETATAVAKARDQGEPASVAKRVARQTLDGKTLSLGLAMVDAVYANDWSPAESGRQIRRVCLQKM
ncbi:hypothetical protein [Variovorax rhizosphaerae]|uniref:Uncharacterized protein n=1 Tax=Variovorax rhizosphaerae TaxID=1836200 RepID=A0ABU8WSE3_9BURK